MYAPEMKMTAETIGNTLLQAFVLEMKLLPDIWAKLSEAQQNDVLDRLRARVKDQVETAVHLLVSRGRTMVIGELEQITIKDGAKAVIKIGRRPEESLSDFYEAQGRSVFVVVNDSADHLGGIDEVKGEADQRALCLGLEYHQP